MRPIIKGTETLINPKNGHKITVQNIVKRINANYFWKVKMMDFLRSLDIIGNKSVRVYSYVLGHINQRTNRLEMTNKQIQHGVEKSYLLHNGDTPSNRKRAKINVATVSLAISKLEHLTIHKNNKPLLIRKRYGRYGRHSYIMINPAMLMRGSEGKRQGLLIQYNKVNNVKVKKTKKYMHIKNEEREKMHKKHLERVKRMKKLLKEEDKEDKLKFKKMFN